MRSTLLLDLGLPTFYFDENSSDEENSELICRERLVFLDVEDQIDYIKQAIAVNRARKLEFQKICEEKKKKLQRQISKREKGLLASHLVIPNFVIGNKGKGPGEFFRPWGVFADRLGRILVSDRMNHRIQVFTRSGEFLYQFGKEGSDCGQFRRPAGIFVDNRSRIIVADKDNHRIQIFTFDGTFIFSFGKCGSRIGDFNYPWGVAANNNCQIAVSEQSNRIQLFDSQGSFLAVCDFGKGIPRGIVFRKDGSLMTTDFERHQIIILDKDFNICGSFGQKGDKKGEFLRPQDLACDEFGRIAVSDSKNYRIQIFDSKGKLYKIFGTKGKEAGQFDCSQGICFHPNGSLIVTDLNNNRIQVFNC